MASSTPSTNTWSTSGWARRVQLHRWIGQRLAEVYSPYAEEVAAELAVHFERGRDFRQAIVYLQHAARNAARRYANCEAVDYLRRALAVVEQLPEGERTNAYMEVGEQLGLIYRTMGNLSAAAAEFEALAVYARDHRDSDREAKALLYLASTLFWDDRQRGMMVAEQATRLIPSIKDPLLRAHTRSYCGFWHLEWRGWQDDNARACAEAVAAARQAGDRALLSLHVGRYAYFQCLQAHYQTACQTAEEGVQLALDVGNAYEYLLCQCYRARALLHLGRWGETLAVLEEALQVADKNAHHPWRTLLQLETAWVYLHTCAFERVVVNDDAPRYCALCRSKGALERFSLGGMVSAAPRQAIPEADWYEPVPGSANRSSSLEVSTGVQHPPLPLIR